MLNAKRLLGLSRRTLFLEMPQVLCFDPASWCRLRCVFQRYDLKSQDHCSTKIAFGLRAHAVPIFSNIQRKTVHVLRYTRVESAQRCAAKALQPAVSFSTAALQAPWVAIRLFPTSFGRTSNHHSSESDSPGKGCSSASRIYRGLPLLKRCTLFVEVPQVLCFGPAS